MSIKEELTKKIAELQAQVNAIKDEPIKALGRFEAKEGEGYWFLNAGGEEFHTYSSNAEIHEMGNVYKTRADALEARDRQLALVRVNDRIDELNAEQNWVADYSDNNEQSKHSINTVRQNGTIYVNNWYTCESASMFNAGCSETIRTVINEMNADIKTAMGWTGRNR